MKDLHILDVDGTHQIVLQKGSFGTSLVAQVAKTPRILNAGGLGSIPGQGTRSYMPQLEILHATMKIEGSTCRSLRPDAAK